MNSQYDVTICLSLMLMGLIFATFLWPYPVPFEPDMVVILESTPGNPCSRNERGVIFSPE
ncbi:hypothetical protein P167DRAFT_145649 [Morchella conica CCBAS932]|uniref:Uncharacterized protein n=1 Tax=Morchella conica CCBAS932 TaxID=1392247 RepID=A0A3N4KQQ9_9PEZI|nr:hypothetical protein P167DRAFT_145649 [Morchella conica CCBAS932]